MADGAQRLNGDEQTRRVFHALADQHRVQIIDELARSNGATASELSERLPISRQGIMKHLAVLEGAELVNRTVEGRAVRFTPNTRRIASAQLWLDARGRMWDRKLANLKRMAESES